MGHSSTLNNVVLFLAALEAVLQKQGMKCPSGAGIEAALANP